ncbi:MAG: hypothetical protein Fur006_54500 [Coleofasciculaceae cyanobacterium]
MSISFNVNVGKLTPIGAKKDETVGTNLKNSRHQQRRLKAVIKYETNATIQSRQEAGAIEELTGLVI